MLALKSGAWCEAAAAVSRYPKLGAPRARAAVPAHCAVLGLHARSGRTRPARCQPAKPPQAGKRPTAASCRPSRGRKAKALQRAAGQLARPRGGVPWNSNCAPRETATAPLFHGLYKRAHHCLRPQRFPVLRLASASSYHQDDGSSPRSLFNAAGCNSARIGCYAQALKNERSRGCAAKFCLGLEKGVFSDLFRSTF